MEQATDEAGTTSYTYTDSRKVETVSYNYAAKPANEIRLGKVKATIWKNEGENGVRGVPPIADGIDLVASIEADGQTLALKLPAKHGHLKPSLERGAKEAGWSLKIEICA